MKSWWHILHSPSSAHQTLLLLFSGYGPLPAGSLPSPLITALATTWDGLETPALLLAASLGMLGGREGKMFPELLLTKSSLFVMLSGDPTA